VAWAHLTGASFIAAGVAVIIGVCARLATAFSTLQIGLFLLLIWIPKATEGSLTPFQRSEAVVTCALMSAAWVMTDSYRGMPWLAVKTRNWIEFGNQKARKKSCLGRHTKATLINPYSWIPGFQIDSLLGQKKEWRKNGVGILTFPHADSNP
jgi:hypothetical protein